jgi:hypothetical protein
LYFGKLSFPFVSISLWSSIFEAVVYNCIEGKLREATHSTQRKKKGKGEEKRENKLEIKGRDSCFHRMTRVQLIRDLIAKFRICTPQNLAMRIEYAQNHAAFTGPEPQYIQSHFKKHGLKDRT